MTARAPIQHRKWPAESPEVIDDNFDEDLQPGHALGASDQRRFVDRASRLPGDDAWQKKAPSVTVRSRRFTADSYNKPEQTKVAQRRSPPSMPTTCFFTASVSTVKQWSRFRDEIPFLVEVFGVVVKVVTDLQKPLQKDVCIQDQGLPLVCRFYEIDRPLPEVHPGQHVRCVGKVSHGGGGHDVLVISLRVASQQELQCKNKLMATSARAMYARMATLTKN